MHYPPVKATTIWAATRCATVSRSLPTDCPSCEQKSVLWTTEICSIQDNIRPFPLSRCTSPSIKSPIAFLWHTCARVACLQLSVRGKCGSWHGQLEREHMGAVGFWLFLQNMCLVFLYQHIILVPTGTYSDMHFHTHNVCYCMLWMKNKWITTLPIAGSQYSRSIPWRTMYLFSY